MRWWLYAVVLSSGCVHAVRVTAQAAPVEAGLAVPFSSLDGTSWSFGDGTDAGVGSALTHAFAKAGRYTVEARDGVNVTDRISLQVVSRPAFHAVPPTADRLWLVRSLEELSPALDFGDRLAGGAAVERWLQEAPVVAFALESGQGGESPIDAREGIGTFGFSGGEAVVGFVGVARSDEQVLNAFDAWVTRRGATKAGADYSLDGKALHVFVDRGVLYGGFGVTAGDERTVRAAPSQGLEADGPTAAALNDLPSGAGVFLVRPPDGVKEWRLFTAALSVDQGSARLRGKLWATTPGPLWTASLAPPQRLLQHGPEGPIAALQANIPSEVLSRLLLGAKGTPRRADYEKTSSHAAELAGAIEGLSGVVDAALYFDEEGFLKATVESEGRPSPKGTLLLEAGVRDADAVARFLSAFSSRYPLVVQESKEGDTRLWRTAALGEPLVVALRPDALLAKAGKSLDRAPEDVSGALAKRFEGAFGPGHVSLLVDVGQLRRELAVPRFIKGIDPRLTVVAQAAAQTLVDQLTRLEVAVLDVSPHPDGALVLLFVQLRPPDPKEPDAR